MDERIGFVGIVIEDLSRSEQVNRILSEYGDMITGRIGVPDHEAGRGVIGVLIKGNVKRLGAMTGKLGNVPGVTVKSAVTKEKGEENEKRTE